MKIKVTKEDIKKGRKENIKYCPIALALKRNFKTDMVEVSQDHETDQIILQIDDDQYDYDQCDNYNDMLYFVQKFDSGLMVEPFTFKINI
tara:strand:- start:435 stop:704 length:270 start_codon:yes stop_codon:yes gene_type:complete